MEKPKRQPKSKSPYPGVPKQINHQKTESKSREQIVREKHGC